MKPYIYENTVLLQKYLKEHPVATPTTVYRKIDMNDPLFKTALKEQPGEKLLKFDSFTSTTKNVDAGDVGSLIGQRKIIVKIETTSGCEIEKLAVVKKLVILKTCKISGI